MTSAPIVHWVDGKRWEGTSERSAPVYDPATGAVLSSDVTGTGPSALVMAGSDVIYMQGSCTGTGNAQPPSSPECQ